MTVKETLRNCNLFSGIREQDLDTLAPAFRQVAVAKGEVILKEGEPARFLYVVEKGRVGLQMTLERPDGSSTGPTAVHSLGPSEAFGWSALVEPYVNTLSATVVEPSRLLRVDRDSLRKMLSLNHDMGYQVMVNLAKLIAERLAETREALVFERSWVEYQQQLSEEAS